MLLNGPDAIYARSSRRRGYVESAISIRWRSAHCEQWRSLRVYCDGSGDDTMGFLKPMARFATWDRQAALKSLETALVCVQVDLGEFPFDCKEIEDLVVALQIEVDRSLLSSNGLITRRDCGEFPSISDGYLFLDLESGHQSISRSARVSEVPSLNLAANALDEGLRRLATPVDRANWLEAYDWSPTEISGRKGWKWDGSNDTVSEQNMKPNKAQHRTADPL